MPPNLAESFLLGFAITAVPGAVFIETTRRTLSNKSPVFSFLVGNATGMAIIILSVFPGLSMLSAASEASWLYALSGSVLTYVGLTALIHKPRHDHNTKRVDQRDPESKYGAFITGLVLAVANPLAIIFWASFITKFLQETNSNLWVILHSMSTVLGSVLFFVILIALVSRIKVVMKPSHTVLIARVFGLIILMYGLVTVGKAF